MGTRVLEPGVKPTTELRLYAHCMKDANGGVSLVALNIDRKSSHPLSLPLAGNASRLPLRTCAARRRS